MAGFLGVHTDLTSKSHDLGGTSKKARGFELRKKGQSSHIIVAIMRSCWVDFIAN